MLVGGFVVPKLPSHSYPFVFSSKLLAPYNGKVVTHILSINTYTVEFSDVKTAQELEAIADELRKNTMFTHVHHNEIVTIQ